MIKVVEVEKYSLAEEIGILKDDILVSINDNNIEDFLDYQFFQAEENLKILVKRNDNNLNFETNKSYDENLGLFLETPHIKSCKNNCIFCFIKQNPKGMRKTIYFCDEDYRYSFMYGNFITLTDIKQKELERIASQRLSPLYISIHATDNEVRKKIFRHKEDDDLLSKLDFLTKNKIELYTQVVLIPGVNDGHILEKTISDLYIFKSSIRSVGIVPVGLTSHRKRLPKIENITPEFSKQLIKKDIEWQAKYKNIYNTPFVNIADEFFLMADKDFPNFEYYGDFEQIENGIGLCRDDIDRFLIEAKEFPTSISQKKRILFVTSTSGKIVLEKYIMPSLNKIENLSVELLEVENNFFGKSVTVSGLLTGSDILKNLSKSIDYDKIFLPPRCINTNGVMLDNLKPEDIQKELSTPVEVFNNNYLEII